MWNMNPNYMGPRNNFAPISNKIVVKNLEDALRRYADFNSEMLYIDANQNLLYNVYTDDRGGKSYDVYEVVKKDKPDYNQHNEDYQKIMNQLNELNKKIEDLYGKHNVGETANTGKQSE